MKVADHLDLTRNLTLQGRCTHQMHHWTPYRVELVVWSIQCLPLKRSPSSSGNFLSIFLRATQCPLFMRSFLEERQFVMVVKLCLSIFLYKQCTSSLPLFQRNLWSLCIVCTKKKSDMFTNLPSARKTLLFVNVQLNTVVTADRKDQGFKTAAWFSGIRLDIHIFRQISKSCLFFCKESLKLPQTRFILWNTVSRVGMKVEQESEIK